MKNKTYPLEEAKKIADSILELLKPHCERIEIAGSIRREKQRVGDIEIVAIPKPYEIGLFADGIASVVNDWQKVKGELQYGKCKYTQRVLPQGIKLDLFFANADNWGLLFAIRTGSAEYSHKVLANGWVERGYTSKDGILHQRGKTYFIREEKDLFNRIGIPYVEPKYRNL
jgi:DNA polymerase/3'-5' exonuclease PolX